jgi:hypothetical protein
MELVKGKHFDKRCNVIERTSKKMFKMMFLAETGRHTKREMAGCRVFSI